MSVNRKELILRRMLAVYRTVPGLKQVDGHGSAWRNRGLLPNEWRPGIILLDGSLRIRQNTTVGLKTNRSYMDDISSRVVPAEMTLLPQTFILLQVRENQDNEGVGEELSQFETSLLAMLMHDDELWDLLGGGGSGNIEYRGNDTDMQTGSSMEGQMQLEVALTYPFDPAELT